MMRKMNLVISVKKKKQFFFLLNGHKSEVEATYEVEKER